MHTDHSDLASLFQELTDEELLLRYGSGTLTAAAGAVAIAEISRRGLQLPLPELSAADNTGYAGDFQLVARFLNPTDAYVLRSCLEMAGVPAVVADAQLVQTNSLWAVALGGVRLLVPALYLDEAKEVLAAFNRGEFALSDRDQ